MMNNQQWRASRVRGGEIAYDGYVKRKLGESRALGRTYLTNDWVITRDPVLSKGAWNWIAMRANKGGRVELRGFDQFKHARLWCIKQEGASDE